MKSPELSDFNIGPRLTLLFALLIALILGGNGLLIWQFRIARLQTERLTGVSQQVISVLRLQESLLRFYQRLDELVQAKDARRLTSEASPLRIALLEQADQAMSAVAHLPPEIQVDRAFLPTLEAIEVTLPSQLEAITSLANSDDWEAVRLPWATNFSPWKL